MALVTTIKMKFALVWSGISQRISLFFNRCDSSLELWKNIKVRHDKDFELILTSKYTWLVMIKTPQRR
jgi:hypothetical protein